MQIKNLYNIRYQPHDNLLATPKEIPNKDEQVTCSRFELVGRIHKLFEKFQDFDWTNVVFSGGLLSSLVQKKYSEEDIKKSDIDLFVFNKNDFYRVYEYFKSKFRKMYSFGYADSSIVTIITYEFDRPIQLIGLFDLHGNKKYNTALDLISDFDISSCQVAFDGENCITTDDFLDFCRTRIAKITKNSIQAYRIIKTINRGYGIHKPNHSVTISNYSSTPYDMLCARKPIVNQVHKSKIWKIDDLDIGELRNDPIVKQKLNKFFVPTHDSGDKYILKKIFTTYSYAIIINDNNLEKKEDVIFRSSFKDNSNPIVTRKASTPLLISKNIKSNYIGTDDESGDSEEEYSQIVHRRGFRY